MDYVFYYIEAHLACFLLLTIIFYKILKGVNKQASSIYLNRLIGTLMLYFLAEIFWALVDGQIISYSVSMLYASNVFTYILITLSTYNWFIVSESLQGDGIVEDKKKRNLVFVPVIVSAILCITAFWTGLLFYIDDSGTLVNGRFYAILVIIPFGYMIASSIKAFSRYANKDKYAERGIYLMIGIFPFAPIVCGILQAIYWRVPFLCYGAVAAVFYVYTTIQDNMISIDPLTQTNNRNQMYKFLIKKMRNEETGMSLFLLIADVDKLRAINDAFGHTEGDRALIRVASAIKDACQGPRGRMFVSRYGGDEFVIVAEMAYRAEATYLAEQIKNNLRRLSDIDGAAYDITVSIGIAQYDYKAPVSLQAFIARADSDLYQNKKMNNV